MGFSSSGTSDYLNMKILHCRSRLKFLTKHKSGSYLHTTTPRRGERIREQEVQMRTAV